jgi:hypothetical protein
MKRFADLKRTERHFEVEDWVYLRLQPYKQHSVVQRKNLKFSLRFYGPYQIEERIGGVAQMLPAWLHEDVPERYGIFI